MDWDKEIDEIERKEKAERMAIRALENLQKIKGERIRISSSSVSAASRSTGPGESVETDNGQVLEFFVKEKELISLINQLRSDLDSLRVILKERDEQIHSLRQQKEMAEDHQRSLLERRVHEITELRKRCDEYERSSIDIREKELEIKRQLSELDDMKLEMHRKSTRQKNGFDTAINEMDSERSRWEKKVLDLEKDNNELRLLTVENKEKYDRIKSRADEAVRQALKDREKLRVLIENGKRVEGEYRDRICALEREKKEREAQLIEIKNDLELEKNQRAERESSLAERISSMEEELRARGEEIVILKQKLSSEESIRESQEAIHNERMSSLKRESEEEKRALKEDSDARLVPLNMGIQEKDMVIKDLKRVITENKLFYEGTINSLKDKMEVLELGLNSLSTEKEELRERESRLAGLLKQAEDHRKELSEASLREIARLKNRLQESEKDISNARKEIQDKELSLDEASVRFESESSLLEEKNRMLETQKKEQSARFDALVHKLKELEEDLRQKDEEISLIRETSASDLSEHKAALNEKESVLEETRRIFNEKIKALSSEVARFEEDMKGLEMKVRAKQEDEAELKKEIDEKNVQLSEANKESLKKAREIQELKKRCEYIESEYLNAGQSVEPEESKGITDKLQEENRRLRNELVDKLKKMNDQKEEWSARIEVAEKNLEEVRKMNAELLREKRTSKEREEPRARVNERSGDHEYESPAIRKYEEEIQRLEEDLKRFQAAQLRSDTAENPSSVTFGERVTYVESRMKRQAKMFSYSTIGMMLFFSALYLIIKNRPVEYDAPYSEPSSIMWDGSRIWSGDWYAKAIMRHNDDRRLTVDSIYYPGMHPSGLAFDGKNIWTVDGWDNKIRKHDIKKGLSVLASYENQGANPSGICISGNDMWVVDSGTQKIYRYDIKDGLVLSAEYASPDMSPSGIFLYEGSIWTTDSHANRVYRHDMDSMLTVSGIYVMKEYASGRGELRSAAWDGEHLWTVDKTGRRFYRHKISDLVPVTAK